MLHHKQDAYEETINIKLNLKWQVKKQGSRWRASGECSVSQSP